MRDSIAHILALVLSVVRPRRPGRHSAAFLADQSAPTPEPVNPWFRPWTGPTKGEAREMLRQQSETTLELGVIRERRRAAALATLGVDYPYTYDGAPFPASAFATAGVSA